jgi:hypothetical protein
MTYMIPSSPFIGGYPLPPPRYSEVRDLEDAGRQVFEEKRLSDKVFINQRLIDNIVGQPLAGTRGSRPALRLRIVSVVKERMQI